MRVWDLAESVCIRIDWALPDPDSVAVKMNKNYFLIPFRSYFLRYLLVNLLYFFVTDMEIWIKVNSKCKNSTFNVTVMSGSVQVSGSGGKILDSDLV